MSITAVTPFQRFQHWLYPEPLAPVATARTPSEPQASLRLICTPNLVMRTKVFDAKNGPLLQVPGSPLILSRASPAVPSATATPRINEQGFDMDDPEAALATYYVLHPDAKKHGYAGTHVLDPKVMLGVVRASVEMFPELNLTLARDHWEAMTSEAQEEWSTHYDVMRAAQQQYILDALDVRYPGAINRDPPVILYSGGQAKGYLRVFFVSANEYGAFYWGNNAITGTDSGSYKAAVWDFMTHGRNRKIWSYPGPTGMLDYSRGNIPAMLWPAVVTHLTTTPNLREVGRLLGYQAAGVAREYHRRLCTEKSFNGQAGMRVEQQAAPAGEDIASSRAYFSDAVSKAAAHRAQIMARFPDLRG